jgi:hypothetical protein
MPAGVSTFKAHLLLWAVMAVLAGCAHTSPGPGPPVVYVPSISDLQPEEYAGEIDKYEKLIQSDLQLSTQQRAHLYLASLYFSPMNPKRNYQLALKHLETYALYDPDFVNGMDPRLLLAAIIEIDRLSAMADAQSKAIRSLTIEVEMLKIQTSATKGNRDELQKDNYTLKQRIGRLQRKIRRLEASNARLNKTIEMLSTLDSRLEEKRSNFIKTDAVEEK